MNTRKLYHDEWLELPDEIKRVGALYGTHDWRQDEQGAYIVIPVIE